MRYDFYGTLMTLIFFVMIGIAILPLRQIAFALPARRGRMQFAPTTKN